MWSVEERYRWRSMCESGNRQVEECGREGKTGEVWMYVGAAVMVEYVEEKDRKTNG